MVFIQAAVISAFLFIGLVIFYNPSGVIEIQRRFYEKINWKIEPISMPKEIQNTRIMGLVLALMAIASSLYLILSRVF